MATATITVGTDIVLANSGEHSPAAGNNLGTRTHQIDLDSLGNSPNARQSAKLDLGANRADRYGLMAALEWASAPTAGGIVDFYWAPSTSGTAGTGNPGNVSGADSAYTGYSSNLIKSLRHLERIGSFVCTAQATTTVQVAMVQGILVPKFRYGTLVVVNRTSQAFVADAVEMSILISPNIVNIA